MLKIFSRHLSIPGVVLWSSESLLIVSVMWAALAVSWQGGHALGVQAGPLVVTVVGVTGLCQLLLYYHNLYLDLRHPTWESCLKILQSIGLAALIVAGLGMVFPQWGVGRGMLGAMAVVPFALILWRLAYTQVVASRAFEHRVLLVGTSRLADDLVMALNTHPGLAYAISARLPELPLGETTAMGSPQGRGVDLLRIVRQSRIDHVVIALGDSRGKLPIADLLRLKFSGVSIEDGLSLYERVMGKVHIDAVKPSWLIFSEGFRRNVVTASAKRAMDLAGALVSLAVVAPLGAILAVLIKLDSPGPVLYRQERVGEHGRPFMLFKFRSMRHDAEAITGPVWAKQNDDRTTRVGRWLRTLRLDEVPQIINVLRGEMSFVGPRPERPCFVEQLEARIPYYGFRHTVKPGITGWAQVRYRYGSSVEETAEKLQYDLCYVKNLSLMLDMTILIDTVKIVLTGRGSR